MTGTRSYTNPLPLPSYNFRVTVDGRAMAFTSVSGLAVSRRTITYRDGFSAWLGEDITRIAFNAYSSITMRRGVRLGDSEFFEWLNADATPMPMEVALCDAEGDPHILWRIARALPVKVDAPEFAVDTNDVAVETLEVMAAGIQVQHVG